MPSLIPIFILFGCLFCFSESSFEISRKELRSKYENQSVLPQSGSSFKSNRIDPSRVVQISWQPRSVEYIFGGRQKLYLLFLNFLHSERVFAYRGFVSDEECDHLISLASGKTNSVVGNIQGLNARSLADLDVKDEVVARVEEKISAWALLPLGYSRPLQILHYASEETNKKYDFYGNKSAWQASEPFIATVILCLSNNSRGGEISFPDSQIKTSGLKSKLWAYSASRNNLLKPVKGNAILFFNVHPNATPDKSSNHERTPVIEGELWSAVKTFHFRTGEVKVQSEPENSDCTDEDESCPQWAAVGECQRNAVYMVGSPDYYGSCRKSCKVC